jgi:hypothetical protein
MNDAKTPQQTTPASPKADAPAEKPAKPKLPPEIGGAPGPEPTRYGDWQHKGRVTDF